MKKRMFAAGLCVLLVLIVLTVANQGFNATRAPEKNMLKAAQPRALTFAQRESQNRNAVMIEQMQPISERVGGETNALAPQALPTLPSQKGLGNDAQPTVPAEPTQGPANGSENELATVIYQDNFVECDKMPEGENENRNYHCGLGEYWMKRKVKGMGLVTIPGEYANGVFTVDGRVSSFSNPAEYGLLFRMAEDGQSGYGAGVYNGQYTIFRLDQGQFTDLVKYTADARVKSGEDVNSLQVATNGNQIALFVNREYVTTVTDDTYTTGGGGIYVYGNEPPIEIAFDNYGIAKWNRPVDLSPQAMGQNSAPTVPTAAPTPLPTATPNPSQPNAPANPCQLGAGEAGLLISNSYKAPMRFTIGGGEWGTHDYDVPGDGKLYLVTFPPGRYTYTASIAGVGTDHGEPYEYKAGYCRQIDYAP